MAKYSTFKYGGGALGSEYGTGDAVEYLTWYFGVAWNGTDFVNEAGRMTGLQTDRGREHLLTSGGAWERFRPGEASASLDNEDGRYNPYNASGPLFGSILPGRPVRVSVDVKPSFSDTTTTYPVLRGIIEDIQPFFQNGKQQARIVVKDGLEWLARRSVALPLHEDTQALDVAGTVAGTVGFDGVDDWTITQLGADSFVVPYAFGNEASALNLINELVDAEAGQVFHSKAGALTFVCNDYDAAGTVEIAQAQTLRDFEIKTPWDVVRTRARITANPLVEGASTILWTYGNEGTVSAWTSTPSPLTASTPYLFKALPGTLTVDAIFSDLAGAATSPTVDYEAVLAQEGFNWVDESADPDLNLVTTDIGTGLRLTWTWDGGIAYDYLAITFADITATPIELTDPVTVTVEDSAAITTYGEKTFELNNTFVQDQARAQAYADWVVAQLKDAHKFPTIHLENRSALQFAPELYIDKINLVVAALGIDETFRIGKISHRWLNPNGFAVRTTFRLEPVLDPLE